MHFKFIICNLLLLLACQLSASSSLRILKSALIRLGDLSSWRPGKLGHHQRTTSAICAVAKNENMYLQEWLHYHKCLGIDKVYLYDHVSERPLHLDAGEYINSGFLEVEVISGVHTKLGADEGFADTLDRFSATIQGQAYRSCLETHGNKHTFMGFIDVDEFVVLHDPAIKSINELLLQYWDYGGVSFYWQLLGSSGHAARPSGSVVQSYTMCAPLYHSCNTQFKTFVNTAYRPVMYSPHRANFTVKFGKNYLVDELERPIQRGRNSNSTHQLASVYHYATKSEEDFKAKLLRGGGAGVTRPRNYLTKLDERCTSTCLDAVNTLARTCGSPQPEN